MNKIPTTSQASFSKGLWFIFEDDNRKIIAYGSVLTGQERVFVNDNLISKKRTLGMTSTHRFIFEEDTYEVIFCLDLQTIDVKCSLIKNGISIDRFKTYQPPEIYEFLFISFFSFFVLGSLVPFFGLPIWLLLIIWICWFVVFVSMWSRKVVIVKED